MPKFKVIRKEEYRCVVEAESEEQVKDLLDRGGIDWSEMPLADGQEWVAGPASESAEVDVVVSDEEEGDDA